MVRALLPTVAAAAVVQDKGGMKMKKYTKPIVDIVIISNEDIITLSATGTQYKNNMTSKTLSDFGLKLNS